MSKVAVVRFPAGYKSYHFKNPFDFLKIGDWVVCDTSNGYVVGLVESLLEASSKAHKLIVQKVDVESHLERKEKQKKIREIRRKMEERRKELEEIQVYAILAKEDEEMADLLKNLAELEDANG